MMTGITCLPKPYGSRAFGTAAAASAGRRDRITSLVLAVPVLVPSAYFVLERMASFSSMGIGASKVAVDGSWRSTAGVDHHCAA